MISKNLCFRPCDMPVKKIPAAGFISIFNSVMWMLCSRKLDPGSNYAKNVFYFMGQIHD